MLIGRMRVPIGLYVVKSSGINLDIHACTYMNVCQNGGVFVYIVSVVLF